MADPRRNFGPNSDTGDDTRVRPDRGSSTGTPRWVEVFGIIVAVLIPQVVAIMIVGGEQGPGCHMPPEGGLG
jgi:hypothetical protein